MEFVLHYRGALKANGDPRHKHALRRHFHAQLARLWEQPQLSSYKGLWNRNPEPGQISSVRTVENSVFIPIVTASLCLVAELSVVMLRPEAPGQLVTQGGDIDNRVKTLLDALTMPRHRNQLFEHSGDDAETLCLLEDDNLITSLSIRSEQLLETADKNDVELYIAVKTRALRALYGNVGLG